MGAIQNKVEGPVSEELALVQAAKQGDDSAFEDWSAATIATFFGSRNTSRRTARMRKMWCRKTFLKAYSNLAKFQEQSKFYTRLVRIAFNEALMSYEREARAHRFARREIKTEDGSLSREITDWSPNPEQQYTQAELREILSKTIQGLPPGFGPCSYEGRGGVFDGGSGGCVGIERARCEIAAVAGSPATTRAAGSVFPEARECNGKSGASS